MKNPLSELIHSSQSVEDFMKRNKNIEISDKQKHDFIASHSKCHNCDLWFEDSDFSSFTLGCVLCERCDT